MQPTEWPIPSRAPITLEAAINLDLGYHRLLRIVVKDLARRQDDSSGFEVRGLSLGRAVDSLARDKSEQLRFWQNGPNTIAENCHGRKMF